MPTPRDRSDTRDSFLDDGSGPVFVRALGGDDPPLVVVHGGPDFDHQYLRPDMDRLATSFRLVFYDQRGRGRSRPADPGSITMATEVADLDRVIAWTGLERVAVLGHSWGGLLAMEHAIRHPDRVSHLILMNTAPASHRDLMSMKQELMERRTPEDLQRIAEIRADPAYRRGDVALDLEYHRIHFRRALYRPAQLDSVIRRLRLGATAAGIVEARAIEQRLYDDTWLREEYDLTPHLLELEVPTLVIHGAADFVPVEVSRHIAASIPRSRVVVLPECGHFAALEQPGAVQKCIERALLST